MLAEEGGGGEAEGQGGGEGGVEPGEGQVGGAGEQGEEGHGFFAGVVDLRPLLLGEGGGGEEQRGDGEVREGEHSACGGGLVGVFIGWGGRGGYR